jgi:hypothetical protein
MVITLRIRALVIDLQSIIHSVNEWFAPLPLSAPARTYGNRSVPPLDPCGPWIRLFHVLTALRRS